MNTRTIILSAFLLTAGGFAATALQDDGGMPAPVEPGPEHELLEKMAGSWTAEADFMGNVEKGTYERTLSMNGLWLVSEYKGTMMDRYFTGHEVCGWDSNKGQYVSCWVDSVSTTMIVQYGTWDAASKSLTMSGPAVDPTSGQEMTMVTISTMPDDDTLIETMHMGSTDAPAMVTITYKRK